MWVHAEKAPIECASAVYHVLNRGNYRQDLFTVCGSAAAFERVLRNSCARLGWLIVRVRRYYQITFTSA